MGKKTLENIGKKLSRLFLGRIKIHTVPDMKRSELPAVMTHFRGVDTHPIRTVPRVGAAMFAEWKKTKAITAGPVLGAHLEKNIKVGGRSFSRKGAAVKGAKLISFKGGRVRNGTQMIKRLPHTRRNRISYIKDPPKFKMSSLLALYYPIYQSRVSKSSLDKKTGRLQFWYTESRAEPTGKSHLLLLRVFGSMSDPLRWVWLPADKR